MDQAQFDPIAQILLEAHSEMTIYARSFGYDHGHPPTSLAKAHHFRAVAQGIVDRAEYLDLCSDFLDSGRLGFTDLKTGHEYVVRSSRATTIEQNKAHGVLFDPTEFIRSKVAMLIYKFHEEGMDLSIAGTRQHLGQVRLEPSGIPTYIATWQYLDTEPPPFEQGESDPFAELDDGEEEEGGEQI